MGNVLKELNAICVCRKCLYNILKNFCMSKNKHYSPVSMLLASTCASLKIVDSKDPMTQKNKLNESKMPGRVEQEQNICLGGGGQTRFYANWSNAVCLH